MANAKQRLVEKVQIQKVPDGVVLELSQAETIALRRIISAVGLSGEGGSHAKSILYALDEHVKYETAEAAYRVSGGITLH